MVRLFFLIFMLTISMYANNSRALQMMKTEQRVALVIGNNIYKSDRLSKLKNPINDAQAMKNKLKSLGFKVFYGENLTVRDMDKKLRTFSSKLKAGGVGLFFFAGHGVESRGENFLMGKDSNLIDKDDIAYESLELNKVIDKMKNSGNRLNIVLLDACRNDPFSRSGGGGLAKVDNAKGMFIAYATSPGDVASDGSGKHGVFTEMILNNIEAEGMPLHNVFKNVKKDVYNKTNHRQRPWTHDDIIGNFFFKLPKGGKYDPKKVDIENLNIDLEKSTHEISIDTIIHNDTTYSTVKSPYTGKIWLDRNLGAKRVCQSYNDKECYGDYYQWGRDADGHEKYYSDITNEVADNIKPNHGKYIVNKLDWTNRGGLFSSAVDNDGIKRQEFWMKTNGEGICPKGFRVPTIGEIKEEILSSSIKNNEDAFKSFLKLPSAGARIPHSGRMHSQGRNGYYHSTSLNNSDLWYLIINSNDAFITFHKDSGLNGSVTVRCIKD